MAFRNLTGMKLSPNASDYTRTPPKIMTEPYDGMLNQEQDEFDIDTKGITLLFGKGGLYTNLAFNIIGSVLALTTAIYLHGYKLHKIIKNLFRAMALSAIVTSIIGVIGIFLLLKQGQNVTTCALLTYSTMIGWNSLITFTAQVAVIRYHLVVQLDKKKNPDPDQMKIWIGQVIH